MQIFVLFLTALLLIAKPSFSQTCEEFANNFIKQGAATQGASAAALKNYHSYLAQSLDLQNATKFSLGANWRTLTPAQRKQFHEIYSQYVIHKYALQMAKYKIIEYKVIATKNDEKRPNICNAQVLIQTIINNKTSQIPLTSVISTKNEGQLLLQDLVLENISVLQLQRDEVESLLKSKGFNGTITIFEKFTKDNQK